MDSEARHPDVLVVYATHKLVGCCWNGADTGDETTRRAHAVDLQVDNVKAHIEIFGDVPLGTCANPQLCQLLSQPTFATARLPTPVPEPCSEQRMALAWPLYFTFV